MNSLNMSLRFVKSLLWLSVCFFLFLNCQPQQTNSSPAYEISNYEPDNHGRKHKKHHKNSQRPYQHNNRTDTEKSNKATNTAISQKVREVLAYVRSNKQAMDGYVGGRRFKNLENNLDKQTASGQKIEYQEWDVNPKQQGHNRGAERLVTGSDGRAWFTSDHYRSFVEIK